MVAFNVGAVLLFVIISVFFVSSYFVVVGQDSEY